MPDGARNDDALHPLVGSSVGKYRVVRVLGSGGMGVLYEARHPVLGSRVAIKTLRASLSASAEERFRNEALAASRLRDDRLPQIFDVDRLEDGTQYIVMEYLEGEDLAHRLARGPMDPGYAARLVLEVVELLAKVHTLGIVHRDIKPANIFIARSTLFGEIPKLLDFGVAHVASSAVTHAGQLLGTPAYMAPEQARDPQRVGPWTDLFSAAVVLYELIAGPGERPWVADSPAAYLAALASATPPRPLPMLSPWAPAALWEVLERGLLRDPAGRYRNALDFARAIEPFAADRSVLYKPPAAVAAAANTDATTIATAREATAAGARAAIQSPVVAQKLAELREAFGRIRAREPARVPKDGPAAQLQPGERRLLAVVYAQVQIGQGGGPELGDEDLEQLTSQFLDLFSTQLSQHGARVMAQPDGGLIGVFGDARVQEDDAERAMTAALAMRAHRDEAAWLLADLNASVNVRIGVHRGWVSQRTRSAADLPLRGDTIGVARRLAESAPLNTILATADAVDGQREWIAVQPLARFTTPGRDRPIEALEVLGTIRSAAGPEGSAFVGRERTLADLMQAFEAAASADAPTVVAISGPAGVGKTRLVSELLARVASPGRGPRVLRVQPLPGVSYGVWAALLEEILAAAVLPQGEGRRDPASLAILAGGLDDDRRALLLQHRPILDELLGRAAGAPVDSSPQDAGARIQLALTLCLEAAARLLGAPGQRLVIALENLHRADAASLQLLPGVVAALRTKVPAFVTLTMRAALPADLPRDAHVIGVDALPPPDTLALANSVAAPAALSPAVQQLVWARSGGNPLFVEHLVAMLREEDLLGAAEARLRSVTTPVSLHGLFLERADRLEPALGDALRLASILGAEFERDVYLTVRERALRATAEESSVSAAAALDELVARGFLVSSGSRDDVMLAFEQPQMQAAVYGTVLFENRQILHALAAEAIERRYRDRPARHFARILHHYSRSANVERTVHFARLAGERALAMAAYDEASEQLGLAVVLQDRLREPDTLAAAGTLHRLAMAFEWMGQLRQAATRAEEAAARLREGTNGARLDLPGPAARYAGVLMTLGELHGLLGDWERSIDAYADAEAWYERAGMPMEAAEALCCRGFMHRARGQPERGAELARRGWTALEASGDRAALSRAGHELGNLLRDLGSYAEALRIFDRAVAAGDDLRSDGRLAESTWGSIAARSGRAMTHAAVGDLAAAIANQQEANELARRDGNFVAQAISEYHLANHYLDAHDWGAAAEHARRAHGQAREMNMPARAFKCHLVQARIAVGTGEWRDAVQHVRDAFAAAERGRIPDDALADATDLLGAVSDRAPTGLLAETIRTAWPHVSHGGSERLRGSVAAIASLLALEEAARHSEAAVTRDGDEEHA